MTLQQLNYVITISEIGSFNRAAEKLYVAQPSLTSAIKELEKEMGIVIFNRTGRGVTLTADGLEFLPYARQVYEQFENLVELYGKRGSRRQKFAVSTQHYSFAVKAFVEMTKTFDVAQYEFAIRETRTRDVLDDVISSRSEIGILYLNDFNRKAIEKMLSVGNLVFHSLIDCRAYVYIWRKHPLAGRDSISMKDLEPYPCLSFEQGDNSNFYLAEEILPTNDYPRIIKACDRATMLNLMVGLNGYTLCSGIICEELNGDDYISVPYRDEEADLGNVMEIGYITRKNSVLSSVGERYITEIKKYLGLEVEN
ncbi:MAG: LysR family transcriptional regulator [Clostridia bacterium]|nr:LysR family transcriptional regulator [Clostridia bacterium]MBQ8972760.1 LysR family transcriptional regulator [Clostridia bacterium]